MVINGAHATGRAARARGVSTAGHQGEQPTPNGAREDVLRSTLGRSAARDALVPRATPAVVVFAARTARRHGTVLAVEPVIAWRRGPVLALRRVALETPGLTGRGACRLSARATLLGRGGAIAG